VHQFDVIGSQRLFDECNIGIMGMKASDGNDEAFPFTIVAGTV